MRVRSRHSCDDYFRRLDVDLRANAPGTPIRIIDLDRLDHNLDLLRTAVGPNKIYRIVVKSLPSIDLLRHAMKRTRTRHRMAFHQPSLNAIAAELPKSDVILGKPLPARPVRTFYETLSAQMTFQPERQIQEMVNGSDGVSLTVDDYVFLRPTQSESVLLQIGDLWAIRQGGTDRSLARHSQLASRGLQVSALTAGAERSNLQST